MTKTELRVRYKELRSKLTDDSIEQRSLEIANKALSLPIWHKTNYHIFLPIAQKKEVNTEYLLQILAGKDKNVILSKSNFEEGTMTNYLLTDNTKIKTNSWGIPEPIEGIQVNDEQIEVVFLPLLAFDNLGNRIGYGKGFYDRFLQNCNQDVIKVGLSFFPAEEGIIPTIPEDIPLNFCITPEKTYAF